MLNWSLGPVTANVAYNYSDSFDYQTGNTATYPLGVQRVKAFQTIDVVGRFSLNSFLSGASIQGRIVNLLDKDPPFVDIANGYLPATASPFGRQFEVTVRAKF